MPIPLPSKPGPDWVHLDAHNIPKKAIVHLLRRIKMRQLSARDRAALQQWMATRPLVPPGAWYKTFPGFVFVGTGTVPTSTLEPDMIPWGTRIAKRAALPLLAGARASALAGVAKLKKILTGVSFGDMVVKNAIGMAFDDLVKVAWVDTTEEALDSLPLEDMLTGAYYHPDQPSFAYLRFHRGFGKKLNEDLENDLGHWPLLAKRMVSYIVHEWTHAAQDASMKRDLDARDPSGVAGAAVRDRENLKYQDSRRKSEGAKLLSHALAYYSEPVEIAAYARSAVSELRDSGLTDGEITQLLRKPSRDDKASRVSPSWRTYSRLTGKGHWVEGKALWRKFLTEFGKALPEKDNHPVTREEYELNEEFSPSRFKAGLKRESSPLTVDSPAFKRWFSGSKIVDSKGNPLPVFHGTTHDFDTFSEDKANKENYHGVGHYFTSSSQDAVKNYAGEGPDLTSRISRRSEEIYEDLVLEREEADVEDAYPKYGTPGYKDLMAEAKRRAKEELKGSHNGVVMPCYLRIVNPVVISAKGGTYFDLDYGVEEDDGSEDYEPAEPSGPAVEVIENLRNYFANRGADASDIVNLLWESQGFSAYDLEEALRGSKSLNEDMLLEEGGPGPSLQHVYREMGYDGIVLTDAASVHSRMGLTKGTAHYMVFSGSQVKSAIGNSGAYSPTDKRITAKRAKGHEYAFGTVQAVLPPGEALDAITAVASGIDEDDLAGKGLDLDASHVTVRYGLIGDPNPVIDYIRKQHPFEVELSATNGFDPSPSSDDAAVLIAPASARELFAWNEAVADQTEFTKPNFAYHPHVTIAYVKPEAIEKYLHDETTAGKKFLVEAIEVCDQDGESQVVKLLGHKPDGSDKVRKSASSRLPKRQASTPMPDVSDVAAAIDRAYAQIKEGKRVPPAFDLFWGELQETGVRLGATNRSAEGKTLADYINSANYILNSPWAAKITLEYAKGFKEVINSPAHHGVTEWARLKRKVLTLVTHERVHAYQHEQMKDSPTKSPEDIVSAENKLHYLARPMEIGAYAAHAVYELREMGQSDEKILKLLRGYKRPGYRQELCDLSVAFHKYSNMDEYVQRKRGNPGDVDKEYTGRDIFQEFVAKMVQVLQQPVQKAASLLARRASPRRPVPSQSLSQWAGC
jgi:2'-5' RNA ligase